MAIKNYLFFNFFCLLLLKATFTSFFKDKKSQNTRNKSFSYYFCLIIEWSGAWAGSVPRTNGPQTGSGRPKNIRIVPIPANTAARLYTEYHGREFTSLPASPLYTLSQGRDGGICEQRHGRRQVDVTFSRLDYFNNSAVNPPWVGMDSTSLSPVSWHSDNG